jgi:predicted secreted protein
MRFLRSAAFVHPLCCTVALTFFGSPAKSKVVTASDSDDGKEVTLSSSQTLEIRLVSVPGTGYGWKLAGPPPEILRLQEERLDVGGSSAPGAPATAVLRFVPLRTGSGTIQLVYVRSWEKGVPPKKTYTLRVRVR